jgi:protein-disulfide isomerase
LSKTNLGEGARRALPLLLWLPLLAAVALLLSGCAAQSSQPSGQEPRQSAEDQTGGSQTGGSQTGGSGDGEQASRGELGHPALGDAGAPVVMVEYADFQ